MRRQLVWLVLTSCACSPSAMADPVAAVPLAPAKAVQPIQTDTPASTPSGTTFTVPAGWTTTAKGQVIVLSPPESGLDVALIEVDAKDAAAAVAVAWAVFDPRFQLALRLQRPEIPQSGWAERYTFHYEDDPDGKLYLSVFAWQAHGRWLVGIVRGNPDTRSRHKNQIDHLTASLQPQGYQPESFAGRTTRPIDARFIREMNEFVTTAMHKLDVPGASIGLIDGGKLVYSGGIGVREQGRPQAVDADTLFPIASNTKTLTTLMLAELVDRHQLSWDEPVTQAYPAFKVGDPALTARLQIQHLPCMCTGIPSDFIELFQIPRSPASIMQALAGMKPVSSFGEKYIYSNFMVDAAGYIAGSVAEPHRELGAAYVDTMQRLLLRPLGMRRSTFDFTKAMRGNYARPSDVDFDGRTVATPMGLNYSVVNAASGGLWSSANDLSRFVMMELAKGKLPDGTRLVSEQNLLRRYLPGIEEHAGLHYGLGVMVDTHLGITVIYNGGDIFGYHSTMIWLPDRNAGAILLSNGDRGVYLRRVFQRKFLEELFDGRHEADGDLLALAAQQDLQLKDDRSQLQIPAEATAAAELGHHYHNDILGDLRVRTSSSGVDFDFGRWHSAMGTHRNADGSVTFQTISPTVRGFEFTARNAYGRHALVFSDDRNNEYVFAERLR